MNAVISKEEFRSTGKELIKLKSFILKTLKLSAKVVVTFVLLVAGLLFLTEWRLNGINFFGHYITPEEVNMFIDSAGTYMYITYIAVVIAIIWGFWLGKAIKKIK